MKLCRKILGPPFSLSLSSRLHTSHFLFSSQTCILVRYKVEPTTSGGNIPGVKSLALYKQDFQQSLKHSCPLPDRNYLPRHYSQRKAFYIGLLPTG
jgi:hypothetical protein